MRSPVDFKIIQAQCLAETIEAYVAASELFGLVGTENALLQTLVADTNKYLQFVAKQNPAFKHRKLRIHTTV